MAPRTRPIWLLPAVIAGVLVMGCALGRAGPATGAATIAQPRAVRITLRQDATQITHLTTLSRGSIQAGLATSDLERRERRAAPTSVAPTGSGDGSTGFVCQVDMSPEDDGD